MTNTPIHRIPSDGTPLATIVEHERGRSSRLSTQLEELVTHDDKTEHLSTTLDWAMQIRETFGFSWEECISIAMTLYYG